MAELIKMHKEQAKRAISFIKEQNPYTADMGSVYMEPYTNNRHQSMCGWLSVFWGINFAYSRGLFHDRHIISILTTILSPQFLKLLSDCTTLDRCILESEFETLARRLNICILVITPPFTTPCNHDNNGPCDLLQCSDRFYVNGRTMYNADQGTQRVTICLWYHDAHYTTLIEPSDIELAKDFTNELLSIYPNLHCKLGYLEADSISKPQKDTSGDEEIARSVSTTTRYARQLGPPFTP